MLARAFLPYVGLFAAVLIPLCSGTGYQTIGSSGVAAQQVFLVPHTFKAVFVDKYHLNYGYPTVNLNTGAPNSNSWVYNGTNVSVFGAEFDQYLYTLRELRPMDDTSCSIGAFFPDGTLANIAGAPADKKPKINAGFNFIRTYAPGPCAQLGSCTQDWVEAGRLSGNRWYPSAQTMVNGDIVVVGGSNHGGLVLNDAAVNVPTYEVIKQASLETPSQPVRLPILEFTNAQNLDPGFSYNMYPLLHLLPNPGNANEMFTLAGNRSEIWDYGANKKVRSLPDIPGGPRTFPASASTALLPMSGPTPATPAILVCGGTNDDIPDPVPISDCWYIRPYDKHPQWLPTDDMPHGGQVMTNAVVLPDSTVLLLNGAHVGCAGGHMADDPVFQPLLYDHFAPAGQRFTTLPSTDIPRLYHSVAILLPSGAVLVAGSNPAVTYSATGQVSSHWPYFRNNGKTCALQQQQSKSSSYPTEYRVEYFNPPYMSSPRPAIGHAPTAITYGTTFNLTASLNGAAITGKALAVLMHPGYSTHGQNQGQRMLRMTTVQGAGSAFTISTPRNPSVMPPGQYLMFMVVDGVPSKGQWISLQI